MGTRKEAATKPYGRMTTNNNDSSNGTRLGCNYLLLQLQTAARMHHWRRGIALMGFRTYGITAAQSRV